jgi:Tol biopolymer transport system component
VAFASTDNLTCDAATDCVRSDKRPDLTVIYVRDTASGVTTRVSRTISGGAPAGHSYLPTISGDGRYVAFTSDASNLVRGDRNRLADVFVHDTLTGRTELVSRRPDGRPGNGASRQASISGDGSMVAFQSLAADLTCIRNCDARERDVNLLWDVFLFNRRTGATLRASAGGSGEWMAPSRSPSLDHHAGVLVFSSKQPTDDSDVMNDDDLYIQILDTR